MPILHNIAQLCTVPADSNQADIASLNDAALVWRDDAIVWTGQAADLPPRFAGEERIDAGGRCVVPGLIDCHTHLCFGGWRGDEFAARLEGRSYQEIQAAGGGITSTVKKTRAASEAELEQKGYQALEEMAALGVTTVEAKSGYGLSLDDEIKQLTVYRNLNRSQPVEIVPTCLGAHLVPPEYADRRDAYLDLLCEELIPRVAAENLARFCDVFIEENAFSLDEGRRILETAHAHGLGLKIHADQLSSGGGAGLAAELGAASAEHLEYASPDDMAAMAASGTVAVSLPIASLYLREPYLPARKWIEAGCRVAVATDFNPGSAPSYHLPLAMLLACLNQHMSPAEVIKAATSHAARAIGLEKTHGSLLPGYQADIAIIDAPDINHWLYHFRPNACVGTIKKGRWIYSVMTEV